MNQRRPYRSFVSYIDRSREYDKGAEKGDAVACKRCGDNFVLK